MVRASAMGESMSGRSCSHKYRKAATDSLAEQWGWQWYTKRNVPKPILHGWKVSDFVAKQTTNKKNFLQYDILIKCFGACYLCALKLSSQFENRNNNAKDVRGINGRNISKSDLKMVKHKRMAFILTIVSIALSSLIITVIIIILRDTLTSKENLNKPSYDQI